MVFMSRVFSTTGAASAMEEVEWSTFAQEVRNNKGTFKTGIIFLKNENFRNGFIPIIVRLDILYTAYPSRHVYQIVGNADILVYIDGNSTSARVYVDDKYGNPVMDYSCEPDENPTFASGYSARYFLLNT